MQKKYHPVVNITHSVTIGVDVVGPGLVSAGIAPTATGIGAIPGIVLTALRTGSFIWRVPKLLTSVPLSLLL